VNLAPFDQLFKRQALLDYLQEKGIERATPVQIKVSKVFSLHPLSVLAPTGSGKTLSFLLPLFDQLKLIEEQEGAARDRGAPRALILTPTRELSKQVSDAAKELGHHLKLRVRHLGDGAKGEGQMFAQPFDVLVAGPGRVTKALKSQKLKLDDVRYVIFDEADQMLDVTFKEDIQLILEKINQERAKVHLFSATANPQFNDRRSELFQWDFQELKVDDPHHLSVKVETFNIYVSPKEKMQMLVTFLNREAKGLGVIFVNNKKHVDEICTELSDKKLRLPLVALHGEIDHKTRRQAHKLFKEQSAILVCTDIAARGIDHPDLQWVLNYDLPFDPVYYVHRSGRVGRLGKTGLVYNFVTVDDLPLVAKINEAITAQTAMDLKPLKTGPLKPRVKSAVSKAPAKAERKSNKFDREPPKGRKIVKKKKTPRYKKRA
jgi:superfamily II DNA/RNA helicase